MWPYIHQRSPSSHPTRVRGLKYAQGAHLDERAGVAPHPGAWIEISGHGIVGRDRESHPTRVRGLKCLGVKLDDGMEYMSHPTRVRGLK